MRPRSGSGSPASPDAAYVFLLFVAGAEPNSRLARQNLAELCEEELVGRSRTEVVDVLQDFEAAARHGVLLTPTLLGRYGGFEVRVIGNLSDRDRLREALRLPGADPRGRKAEAP